MGRSPSAKIRRRPTQDLVLLLQQPVTFTQLTHLGGLGGGGTGADTVLDIGEFQPAVQTRLGDPEILRDLSQGRLALAGHRDHVTAELGGECFRHDQLPSSTASGLSVDALRHYDEVGVLKPASVDPRTSYRRYQAVQLRDARLICQLRGVDLPVEEVRTVLQADGPEHVREILRRHQRRLAERTDALEKMLATSAAYVEKGVPLPSPRGCRVVQVMVSTRDRDESVRFYTEAFGLEFTPTSCRSL